MSRPRSKINEMSGTCFKFRKYVVNRVCEGLSKAKAAHIAGVSEGFDSKRRNCRKASESWDTFRSLISSRLRHY